MTSPNKNKPDAPITVDDVIKALRTKKLSEILTEDQINELSETFTVKQVTSIHRNSDKDLRPDAIHHTIGGRSNQAAPGDHNHDGGSSSLLLDNTILSGSRGSATATVLQQVIGALVKLGVTDSTSP